MRDARAGESDDKASRVWDRKERDHQHLNRNLFEIVTHNSSPNLDARSSNRLRLAIANSRA